LVQVRGDDERRSSVSRQLGNHGADDAGRPYVETVGRLVEHDDLGGEGELAREDDLLDVPARKGADPSGDAGRADIEVGDELLGPPVYDRALDAPAPPEGLLADALEKEVQADGERADDPFAQPIVGDVSQAELLARGHGQPRDLDVVEQNLTCAGRALPGNDLSKRALAVPIDSCDAEDLAEREHEADILDSHLRADAGGRYALQLEHGLVLD